MRRALRLAVVVCFAWAAGGGAAAAQDRLFALVRDGQGVGQAVAMLEIDAADRSLGAVRHTYRLPAHVPNGDLVALGGGRFVVWSTFLNQSVGASTLFVLDTISGTLSVPQVPLRGIIFAADPLRPRVFVGDYSQIAILDMERSTIRFLPISAIEIGMRSAYAAESDELFVVDEIGGMTMLHRISVSTGIDRSMPIPSPPGIPTGVAVDSAGARVFVAVGLQISAYDAATGALLARGGGRPISRRMMVEQDQRRLIVPVGLGLLALDTTTLSRVAVLSDVTSRVPFQALRGSRGSLHVFNSTGRTPCMPMLRTFDDATGGLRAQAFGTAWAQAAALQTPACLADVALLKAPDAPILTAQVSGHRVTLTWTDPGGAVHFDVEAGSAPLLRNLLLTSTAETHLTADDVPPGIYYVRVRAINPTGRSLPSTEVRVVVP